LRPDSPRDRDRDAHLAGATERLGTIVEAAERAAEAVIDDAEAQARRYLAEAEAEAGSRTSRREAELARLVDSLLADAVALRDGAERMVESLRRAQEGLRPPVPESPPEAEEREPAPALAPVEQLRPRGAAPPEPAPPQPEPVPPEPLARVAHDGGREAERAPSATAGARLLATQLAVSGSSREEIDNRLRSGFELEDTGAILDAILGPEE